MPPENEDLQQVATTVAEGADKAAKAVGTDAEKAAADIAGAAEKVAVDAEVIEQKKNTLLTAAEDFFQHLGEDIKADWEALKAKL